FLFREQGDDEVVLIVSSGGDHHVDLGHARGLERGDLAGIGHHPADIDVRLESRDLLGVDFHDEDVVAVELEIGGHGHADTAPARNGDLHQRTLVATATAAGDGWTSSAASTGRSSFMSTRCRRSPSWPTRSVASRRGTPARVTATSRIFP